MCGTGRVHRESRRCNFQGISAVTQILTQTDATAHSRAVASVTISCAAQYELQGSRPQLSIQKKKPQVLRLAASFCGKAGIRTLGTRKGTTVFETVPIDHSGTFPNGLLRVQSYVYFLIPQVFARQFLSTNFLCDCQIGNRLSQKDIFWRIMRGGHSINGIFANFVT